MASVSFDRAAQFYDATRGYGPGSAEGIMAGIVRRTGASMATRFLELGVGTGRIALPFIVAGYSYTGIDLAPAMLAVLRAKVEEARRSPALVIGDVTGLPFAAGSFDVVIAVHVLHLVGDWRATLAEARRVMGGRGQLLLAGDSGVEPEATALEALPPPAQAQRVWSEALRELGLSGREGQPGIWPSHPDVAAALRALGAVVETADLAPYERLPFSARTVVQGYRERIFSSDWARPDDLHQAAVTRLEAWLAEQCPDPDTPYALKGRFGAVVATWS